MEVLANSVRQNVDIKGLSLNENGTEHAKIVQYVDDTTLFLRNTHEMRLAINMLEHFGSVAGTQLNLEKCEGLWIGSYKNRQENCSLHNMKWPKVSIRYLGIYIGHDAQKCYKLNFENNILQLENILNEAEKRHVTLFGKVCIIKPLNLRHN